jgi:hypothetical protein
MLFQHSSRGRVEPPPEEFDFGAAPLAPSTHRVSARDDQHAFGFDRDPDPSVGHCLTPGATERHFAREQRNCQRIWGGIGSGQLMPRCGRAYAVF